MTTPAPDPTGRRLGATGPTVSALGLGLMGMSDLYGPADEAESIATIHAALDAGVTLLDTGDFYGMGHNELLIARRAARAATATSALISVKFGALRGPDGGWLGVDARPAAVKNFLAYTPAPPRHRPRRHLPAGPPRPERADRGDRRRDRRAGQGRLRPAHRPLRGRRRDAAPRARRAPDRRPADRVLADLARHRGGDPARPPASSASASPRTACSRAACSAGHWTADRDRRGRLPRPPAPLHRREPRRATCALVEALRAVAAARGATRRPGRDRLGALPRRGHRAAGRRPHAPRLAEALGALDLALDAEDLAAIEAAVPAGAAAGTRYDAAQMAILDSEK